MAELTFETEATVPGTAEARCVSRTNDRLRHSRDGGHPGRSDEGDLHEGVATGEVSGELLGELNDELRGRLEGGPVGLFTLHQALDRPGA